MKDRKQAILIIAHNNIEVLKKSLQLLDSNNFDIYIHIDKKSNIEYENVKNICKYSKLFFYKKYDLRWGDYSVVECEMFLLKNAVKQNDYEYYHLISGTDLPIKNFREIYNFFNLNYGKEFVHFMTDEITDKKAEWLKYFYFMRLFKNHKLNSKFNKVITEIQKIFRINRIKKLEYKPMTGSQWFSITDNFCKYLVSKSNDIKRIFKNTQIPDEMFVQTILYNSDFRHKLYKNDYDNNYDACSRLIVWKEKDHPYTWKIEDYDEIIKSNCMFARKFEYDKDSKIIELIFEKNMNMGE